MYINLIYGTFTFHQFKYRKSELVKNGADSSLTSREILLSQNFEIKIIFYKYSLILLIC